MVRCRDLGLELGEGEKKWYKVKETAKSVAQVTGWLVGQPYNGVKREREAGCVFAVFCFVFLFLGCWGSKRGGIWRETHTHACGMP